MAKLFDDRLFFGHDLGLESALEYALRASNVDRESDICRISKPAS